MENLNKEINLNKKIIILLILANIIVLGASYSYALFETKVIKNNVVVIKTANIVMNLTSNDLTNNKTLTLAGNETKKINIKITNESNHDALARLYYIGNISNITFTSETDFKDENKIGIGKINSKQSKELTISIKNNTSNSITIELGAQEGLIGYELELKEGRNSVILQDLPLSEKFKQVLLTRTNSYVLEDEIYYISGKADDNNASTTDDIDFNYVWYSGKLWRITALYPDGRIKMITEDLITTLRYENNGIFYTDENNSSNMYQWLNQEFLSTLYNYENIIAMDSKWNATTSSSIGNKLAETTIVPAKVGFLNSYEYYMSSSKASSSNGYLNIGFDWFLLNPHNNTTNLWGVGNSGSAGYINLSDSRGVRPSIVLKSMQNFIGGTGTKLDPYRLKGDKEEAVANTTLLNTRMSGEYVKFDGSDYKIVSFENGTTKLIKADYIKDTTSILTKQFASSSRYGASITTGTENHWDYYLNNIWKTSISDNYEKMLVEGTYYIKKYVSGNYKTSVCKTISNSVSVKSCIETGNVVTDTWIGYVGLPRYAEMFATQPSDYYSTASDTSYIWLITPRSTTEVWRVDRSSYGYSYNVSPSNTYAVRPTINLNSNVVITGGDGTIDNPYQITL